MPCKVQNSGDIETNEHWPQLLRTWVRKAYFFNFSSKINARNHSRQENMVDLEQVHAIAKKNHYSGNLLTQHLTFWKLQPSSLRTSLLLHEVPGTQSSSPTHVYMDRNTQSWSTRPSFLAFWPETQGLEGNYSQVIQCLCPMDPAIKEHSHDLWPPIMRVCPLT